MNATTDMDRSDGIRVEELPLKLRVRRKRFIFAELKRRTAWFVRLRWWVPPAIAGGAGAARALGFDFQFPAIMIIVAFILSYNLVLFFIGRRLADPLCSERFVRSFTVWQVALDYAAMFLLIHFTGGVASPLIFFFIFHIILASILLPRRAAFSFCALVVAGMLAIALGEYSGLLDHRPLVFQGDSIGLVQKPTFVTVTLLLFSASIFITAVFTTAIVGELRRRIVDIAQSSVDIGILNEKLRALHTVAQAIVATRELKRVLNIAKIELAGVMDVKAVAIKLLSEDGKRLRYADAFGLPDEIMEKQAVELEKSPLNRRVIQGEPFVTGRVSESDFFQFGEGLARAGFKSVLFVPLRTSEKVIGILGAYCCRPDWFDEEDVKFFRLAAELLAIAIENARAYEAVENLGRERTHFMLQVAHNLRAPLAATVGILDVVRNGHLGELNDEQKEYLRRIDRRARTMISMIGELLSLATSRTEAGRLQLAPVDFRFLAGRLERTFQDETGRKGLTLRITVAGEMPDYRGDSEMLERLLENLVSNAIKYTREGAVNVVFSADPGGGVRIEVHDTGIGIPAEYRTRLFSEFFRAENAKEIEEIGTGLGLAIVKEIAEKHGGRVEVESVLGQGSTFTVHLPAGGSEEQDERTGDG